MDDPAPVRRAQGVRHLRAIRQRLTQRQGPAPQAGGQRLALEVLHDQEVDAVLRADVVENADVRVGERGNGARFLLEPAAALRVAGHAGRQHLERHRAP